MNCDDLHVVASARKLRGYRKYLRSYSQRHLRDGRTMTTYTYAVPADRLDEAIAAGALEQDYAISL